MYHVHRLTVAIFVFVFTMGVEVTPELRIFVTSSTVGRPGDECLLLPRSLIDTTVS